MNEITKNHLQKLLKIMSSCYFPYFSKSYTKIGLVEEKVEKRTREWEKRK